jgi:hypothetical protein
MFTSQVTPASHSGSVIVQSYQYSLFFITFCNLLNNVSEIIGPTVKNKANAKTGFVNRRIFNLRRVTEPVNVY